MKSNENIKFFIVTGILLVFIGLIVLFAMVDINLGIVKISSVKTLLAQKSAVNKSQDNLKKEEVKYTKAISEVKTQEAKYKDEKTKYDAISNDTVKMINEATTEENYNIEYMWIKLGNYAKSNNLTILVTEPGGTAISDETTDKTATTSTTGTTNTTSTTGTTNTTGTTSTTTNGTTTAGTVKTANANVAATANTATATTGTSTTGTANNTTGTSTTGTTGTNNTTKTTNPITGNTINNTNVTTNSTTDVATPIASSNDSVLKIQVKGSYIDVSDFIFEVENDKSLRFKLDNISIECVSGTIIKATFDVKNLIIKK